MPFLGFNEKIIKNLAGNPLISELNKPPEKTTVRSDIFKIFQGYFSISSDSMKSERLDADFFVLTFNNKLFSYFYQIRTFGDYSFLKIRKIDRFNNLASFFEERKKPILILIGWIQFIEEGEKKKSQQTITYFENNDIYGSDSFGTNQDIFYFHYNKVKAIRAVKNFENINIPFAFLDILKTNFGEGMIFMICRYDKRQNYEDENLESKVRPPLRMKKKFIQKMILPTEKILNGTYEKKNNLSYYLVKPLPKSVQEMLKKEKEMENQKDKEVVELKKILNNIETVCLEKVLKIDNDIYLKKNMEIIKQDLSEKKQEIQKVCKYLSISLLEQIKLKTQSINNSQKEPEKEEGEVELNGIAKHSEKNGNFLLIEEINPKMFQHIRSELYHLISVEFQIKNKSSEYLEQNKNQFEEILLFIKQSQKIIDLKFKFQKSWNLNSWGCLVADFLYDLPQIQRLRIDFSETNINDYTFYLMIQSLKKMLNLNYLELFCDEINLTDDSAENLKNSLNSDDFWEKFKEAFISLKGVKFSQENLANLRKMFKEKYKRIKFYS